MGCKPILERHCRVVSLHCILLPPANEVCEGYVFTGVCDSVNRGGRAWLLTGGACMVAHGGGTCVVAHGGACVVAHGGCAWLLGGACVFFFSQ